MGTRKKKYNTNNSYYYGFLIFIVFIFLLTSQNNSQLGNIIKSIKDSFAVFYFIFSIIVATGFLLYHNHKEKQKRSYKNALIQMGVKNPLSLSPIQFEDFCCFIIQGYGWNTKTTKKTGDFGADIIAIRGNVKLIVQCKRYQGAVGIKAIQEAHTAASYYNATHTAVMICSNFTRPAIELAQKTRTGLIIVGVNEKYLK